MKKTLRSMPAILVISFLVGYAFHSIPGASDPRTFWVGNLSWPYLLVPALACLGERRLGRAVVKGIGSTLAMVLGFYNALGLFTVSALEIGLDPGTSRGIVFLTAWREYLKHHILGLPGDIPWITVAVVSGASLGLAHHLTLRSGARPLFWTVIAAVGILEPLLHFAPVFAALPFAGYRFDSTGQLIAATQWLLCLALLVAAYQRGRAGRVTDSEAQVRRS